MLSLKQGTKVRGDTTSFVPSLHFTAWFASAAQRISMFRTHCVCRSGGYLDQGCQMQTGGIDFVIYHSSHR